MKTFWLSLIVVLFKILSPLRVYSIGLKQNPNFVKQDISWFSYAPEISVGGEFSNVKRDGLFLGFEVSYNNIN